MAIYINKEHPGVFCNTETVPEPNQVEFRRDYLSELIEQQLVENRKLQHSFVHMQLSQNDWNQHQSIQYKKLDKRINELKELQEHQEAMEHQVIDWLEKIEDQNNIMQQTINYDQRIHNDLLHQVNEINQSQKGIVSQIHHVEIEHKEIVKILEEFTSMNKVLISRVEQVMSANEKVEQHMEAQNTVNQQILDQITSVDETQKDVLSRVDDHEGLMEKILRQVDHLRSILFERTNFIEEKLEKVIQSSADYFQKIKN
ncbi:hypothetical protein [Lysinibacillus sp. SGAir0095]|uniref:hypothetical protein n=1 Tax=Lysinibacillus sp. SGAir0095 TaxID=2070463 RepID=UPI0010CCD310|nr:hypothetical protein [Lysinibacillus sp. SGAir0095]QCR32646.1 hypothetical protein C1N55_10895 [Lysinibacillus sp. SGAir0095]